MIGIICAMDTEVIGYINAMKDKRVETVSGYDFTTGMLNGKKCVVVMCGIGKVNAAICAQAMIMRYAPQYIINSGIGGGLTTETDIGDIVIAKCVVQHDMDTTSFGDPMGLLNLPGGDRVELPCDTRLIKCAESICESIGVKAHIGVLATGDQFITSREKRLALNKSFNAIACEMEGGSIGQACYRSNIPFIIIRAISDNVEKNNHMDYLEFKKICSEKSAKIVSMLLDIIDA